MRIINNPSRKELYDMTTQQIYNLSNQIARLEERIKSELVLRGNY